MRPARAAAAALAIVGVALTACTGAVGKAGAPASGATVLHLGAADVNNAQLATFVAEVHTRSHGRLTVEVDRKTYFSETPGGEGKLAAATASGRVDLAYLPSRDWARAGATGFAALQAAGLLTTTAQEIHLSQDPVAAELLGGLAAKDAVGLGLVPDEPRRLITRTPVLSVADLQGQRIRIGDSPQTAAMLRGLGATVVQGITAAQTKAGLGAKSLDGVETGPTPASQNTYQGPAPYLTSFALIPKFEVLAANAATWKRLPAADRRVLQAAATATVRKAATDLPARETKQLTLLCKDGAVITRPPASALATILATAERARPTDAADVALIGRIAAAVGSGAPEPDAAPLPSDCTVATTALAAERHHGSSAPGDVTAASVPSQLVGTWQVDVTAQDFAAQGATGADFSTEVTYIYKLSADGTLYETQSPDFPDQGPLAGTWRVHGDRIRFLSGTPGGAEEDFDETVSWSFFKGVLHLKSLIVQDQAGLAIYSVPWRKIG